MGSVPVCPTCRRHRSARGQPGAPASTGRVARRFSAPPPRALTPRPRSPAQAVSLPARLLLYVAERPKVLDGGWVELPSAALAATAALEPLGPGIECSGQRADNRCLPLG